MKRVAIVGLEWLGIPSAMSPSVRGWQVTGNKTTQDGVEAARMSGIDNYLLRMEPELVYDSDDLDALMDADTLVIMPLTRCNDLGNESYLQAVQESVDSAPAHRIPRIIFTSSASAYGDAQGTVKETIPCNPVTSNGRVLGELGDQLHNSPGTSADILCFTDLVGPGRHPGRFFAGRTASNGKHGVSLVRLEGVIGAITLLLQAPRSGHVHNICVPAHPARDVSCPQMACLLGLKPPQFRNSLDSGKGETIDGSWICSELGFEYQYLDPLVMPLE